MNNGKYFSLMDVARVDLMLRAGLAPKLFKLGWFPVVDSETAKFKKSIKLFDKIDIVTEIIGWDEKAVLFKRVFLNSEVIVCESVVRMVFLKKSGGLVEIDQLKKEVGVTGPSPVIRPSVSLGHDTVTIKV